MFGENLKKVRQELGLSVAKFAEKLEMSPSTLTGYEREERTPSWLLFTQLYKNADVNLNWFVSGKGEMFNAPEYNEVKTQLRSEVLKILKEEGLIQ